MGYEDTKAEDSQRVWMGLSFAWKASLAIKHEDSFLCNRLCVTLGPSGVYINRRVRSIGPKTLITIVIHARLLGFSHYDLVVDQLL